MVGFPRIRFLYSFPLSPDPEWSGSGFCLDRRQSLFSQARATIRTRERYVILSERSEPKDLRTKSTAKVNEVWRSFDSAYATLRMTTALVPFSLCVWLLLLTKPDNRIIILIVNSYQLHSSLSTLHTKKGALFFTKNTLKFLWLF